MQAGVGDNVEQPQRLLSGEEVHLLAEVLKGKKQMVQRDISRLAMGEEWDRRPYPPEPRFALYPILHAKWPQAP